MLQVARVLLLPLFIGSCLAKTKIVLTNDDGWAVANIRAEYDVLVAAGYDVVLSCPAQNESGQGSLDVPPKAVGATGCEYDSCPPGSPAVGFNASNPRLNYVNSYPVTSARYGIQNLAPRFFNGSRPDLAIAGPNIGVNVGFIGMFSGTVGAATEAAKEGVPSIAFSGVSGAQVSYTTLETTGESTTAAEIYSALSLKVVEDLLSASLNDPILPPNVTLNVSFPAIAKQCTNVHAFSFVLTRVNGVTDAEPDVQTCNSTTLPTETAVVGADGCFSSVSVMNATTKGDVDASMQGVVLQKLAHMLTCFNS